MGSNIVATLRERGLLQDMTDPELEKIVGERSLTVYAGFDPSADSLHVGNLVSIIVLKHFQLHGHKPIALVGGATGMVGDPSGRSVERNLLDEETLQNNIAGIRENLERFLDFEGDAAATLVNNFDWIGKFSFLEFLRDVGKYFRVGDMISKDSVKRRLDSESGLSFTELSYQLLQSYDFYHLHKNYGCEIQSGGSDQWGNITGGTELIRRISGKQGFGITTPLLTNAQGEKMGKTAQGAVWLNGTKLSPYEFYQFWIRQEDAIVEKLLKMMTFLPLEEIATIMEEHLKDPSKRYAQRRLSESLTIFVHGEEEFQKAKTASEALFGGELSGKSDEELKSIFNDVPSIQHPRSELEAGIPVVDLLVAAGLCASKKQAKTLLAQNGVYFNNSPSPRSQEDRLVTASDLASDTMLIIRAGKKNYCLVQFV